MALMATPGANAPEAISPSHAEPEADEISDKLSPCPRPPPSPARGRPCGEGLLGKPWYWYYVLLAADALLRRQRHGSVADPRGVAPGDQGGVRRQRLPARHAERHSRSRCSTRSWAFRSPRWADRWSRRNVLALAVATWSAMTALCGMAVNFPMLFAARVGTAIGEAGGSPPSHSLISDYFPKSWRGTAFSDLCAGRARRHALGAAHGRLGQSEPRLAQHVHRWSACPGSCWRSLVRLTVSEPPRGMADGVGPRGRGDRETPGHARGARVSSGRDRRSAT